MKIANTNLSTSTQLSSLRERARQFGFCWLGEQRFSEAVTAKPRSHDDGARNGPFMGGLGNPLFSRSIDGHFDRWQLEPGVHLHENIESAFIALRWSAHAGQYHQVIEHTRQRCHLAHRIESFDGKNHPGEIVLSAHSSQANLSFHLTAKANQNATGTTDAEQRYTLAWLQAQFHQKGKFTDDDSQWRAHWHEPLMSALAAEFSCAGEVTFAITFDHPVIAFGQGRQWWRAYTRQHGRSGRVGHRIANHAFQNFLPWLAQLDQWQDEVLRSMLSTWNNRTAGAILNEYWSIAAGAAAWVVEPITPLNEPQKLFRNTEHFGWLEGYDSGYFYYNTLDLYVYAFAGLQQLWPDLAQGVFEDYQDTAALVLEDQRIVYRQGAFSRVLIDGKLPHDLGSPSADPWVSINGYVMRDDPNVWKDHNPSFIVSFYLHKTRLGQNITGSELTAIQCIADFVERQITPDIAIPVHTEFGDSTWDNLDMQGLSSYTGSWVIAAWAVMEKIHLQLGHSSQALHYAALLKNAQSHFESLWTGQYYRCNSSGKYANATQCDALIGVYYAKLAGLDKLLPTARIQQHLEAVWDHNVMAYRHGCYGPLLVAEPGKHRFDRDGGEELQVNEVLVGSAWIYVGMLATYGLEDKARLLADNMATFHYQRSGLQFRTPAAWNGDGQFRAPINMRPLAIALLRYS